MNLPNDEAAKWFAGEHIPTFILRCKKISSDAKIVYTVILSKLKYASDPEADLYIFALQDLIEAIGCCFDGPRVKKALGELDTIGFIRCRKASKKPRIYSITLSLPFPIIRSVQLKRRQKFAESEAVNG